MEWGGGFRYIDSAMTHDLNETLEAIFSPGGSLAAREGFEPLATYSGPCDLCTHARTHLARHGRLAELGPAGFYDPRSVAYD